MHKIYPLRRCQPISKKPCHYYQINECLGPCCPNNKYIDYSLNIRGINDFLKGKNKNIFNKIKNVPNMKKLRPEFKSLSELLCESCQLGKHTLVS
ncbi:MAG: hypothetical protein Q8869_02210, partial [Candidatus Phytoplasma australasiaticum]|nr:hypothetical protein [Candidatus Phytoplasma australasiaticum]